MPPALGAGARFAGRAETAADIADGAAAAIDASGVDLAIVIVPGRLHVAPAAKLTTAVATTAAPAAIWPRPTRTNPNPSPSPHRPGRAQASCLVAAVDMRRWSVWVAAEVAQ